MADTNRLGPEPLNPIVKVQLDNVETTRQEYHDKEFSRLSGRRDGTQAVSIGLRFLVVKLDKDSRYKTISAPPYLTSPGTTDEFFSAVQFKPAPAADQKYAVISVRTGAFLRYDAEADTFVNIPLGAVVNGFCSGIGWKLDGTLMIAVTRNGNIWKWTGDITVPMTFVSTAGTLGKFGSRNFYRSIIHLGGDNWLIVGNAGAYRYNSATDAITTIFDSVVSGEKLWTAGTTTDLITGDIIMVLGQPKGPTDFGVEADRTSVPQTVYKYSISMNKFVGKVTVPANIADRFTTVIAPAGLSGGGARWFFGGTGGLLVQYNDFTDQFVQNIETDTLDVLTDSILLRTGFSDELIFYSQRGTWVHFFVNAIERKAYNLRTNRKSNSPDDVRVKQEDPVKMNVRGSTRIERSEVELQADAKAWVDAEAPLDDGIPYDASPVAQIVAPILAPTYSLKFTRGFFLDSVHIQHDKGGAPVGALPLVSFLYDDDVVELVASTGSGLSSVAVPTREVTIKRISLVEADGPGTYHLFAFHAYKSIPIVVKLTMSDVVTVQQQSFGSTKYAEPTLTVAAVAQSFVIASGIKKLVVHNDPGLNVAPADAEDVSINFVGAAALAYSTTEGDNRRIRPGERFVIDIQGILAFSWVALTLGHRIRVEDFRY